MKVLLLNTSDIEGGAARAAYRLHQGFKQIGVNTQMLVQAKSSDDATVIAPRPNFRRDFAKLRPSLDSLLLKLHPQHEPTTFSPQWVPDFIAFKVKQLTPDIINLHWVCDGFLQIETVARLGLPVVWTLSDMWAFTGGCHYDQECGQYKVACGRCPQLSSTRNFDLSRWIWQRKEKAWGKSNLTIVTPSKWLAECAGASSLLKNTRIEVIPYALDTYSYRPIPKQIARQALGLPLDKKIILFGAIKSTSDSRKGFHLLQLALKDLSQSEQQDNLTLCIFGSSELIELEELNIEVYCMGNLHDDISLALAYSAADVMVVPSIQEAFGQTASEAFACATPVVGFDGTGLSDIIDHQQNGYLAQSLSAEDLAKGIIWVLENEERRQKLAQSAREKAERSFTLELQASRYLTLFEELLEQSRRSYKI